MTKIKSACMVHPNIGWSAASIVMQPGVYRYPNNDTARMRAGMAMDLDVIREWRLAGELGKARGRLAFARDMRRFMTAYA